MHIPAALRAKGGPIADLLTADLYFIPQGRPLTIQYLMGQCDVVARILIGQTLSLLLLYVVHY